MKGAKKVTVKLPAEILERAERSTGQGIRATICMGLSLLAAQGAYEGLRKHRGRVIFSNDLARLRKDRP